MPHATTRRILAFAVLLAACKPKPPAEYRGAALPEPLAKPAVVLADAAGKPFDFRKETEGKLALLFFGYTHCPDVCPMHMANLAAVLRESSFAVQNQTRVLFVTVDPARDTPAHLQSWLKNFDPAFIGLHGSDAEVARFQRELNLPLAVTTPGATPGEYQVGHASQIIAFTPDGYARYVYPFGTRQADWAHDLPQLALAAQPPVAPVEAGAAAAAPGGGVTVTRALIPVAQRDGPGALYAVITNASGRYDTLTGVATQAAGRAELHRMRSENGRMMMAPVSSAALAPGETLRLAPGGYHGMLLGLAANLVAGAEVPVTFTFKYAGPVTVMARVVPYDQVERALEDRR
jgi:cytochrome oxidase Cu insertion factor (SCO1/SenC/PrrC family)/copper(I)-binding protein